jgi:hypothetical protein
MRETQTTGVVGDARDDTPRCPECHSSLESGTALAFSSALSTAAYLCKWCRLLFAHDLTVLARFVG